MNKGYKGNNGISKAQVIELIVAEVAKIQTGGLDLSTYAKKSEVSTQISNAIKNFLTKEEIQALLEALDIPTKLSELQNDLNLVNEAYVNNAIESKKHYTEEEIKTIVEGVLDEKEISGAVDEEAVQSIVNTSLSQLNIPTKTSQLTNDSNFITGAEASTQISNATKNFLTEEEIQVLLDALNIPTKISELQNDSSLVNETYVNNAINAKKHYTEEEIKTIIERVLEEKGTVGAVDEEAVQTIINESLSQLNIPTKTSQLTNDSGFITGSEVDSKIANASLGGEVDLTSYAKKTELADKVDKVSGKSLISDTEIQRLATLKNYDDTEIKTSLSNKVDKVSGKSLISDTEIQRLAKLNNYDDAEIKTSLSNKVDKVSGKSLISDTEIQRLATLKNYDDTEVKTSLSNKVDKVNGKSLISNSEIQRLATLKNYDDTEIRTSLSNKVDKEELVVLSATNGKASMTLASLHSIVITENTTINLPVIEEDYWETKLYIKGQEGNVITLKEGGATNEIELGCDKQHVLKIVKINGEFNAELVDYSPEGSGEEEEEELKEVSVVDNNLQLLDCPIQICNNLADNTTILLPSLTEEYKEVKLIFSAESDLDLILSDGEDTLSITSSTGVKELLIKKVFGEWSIVLIDLR